jgi:hypothetical protein
VVPSAEPLGRRFLRWNVGALVVAAAGLAVALATTPARASLPPFADGAWDDGLTEVARYDAECTIDGKTVAYPLTIALRRVGDALELVRTEEGHGHRRTVSLRIACAAPERLALDPRSAEDAAWLEDQLPATLRGLDLGPTFERKVRLIPSASLGATVRAFIVGDPDETVVTPAGSFACARVRVLVDDATLKLWFAREAPRPLVKLEASDGRKALLRSLERTSWKD